MKRVVDFNPRESRTSMRDVLKKASRKLVATHHFGVDGWCTDPLCFAKKGLSSERQECPTPASVDLRG